MFRSVLVSCVLVLACRIAIAEEGAIFAEHQAKQGELQLNDLVTVLFDNNSTSILAHQQTGAPPFQKMVAIVVNIRRDGKLEIEARREVEFGGKVWEQSLTGAVSRNWIGPDRTVPEQNICECRLRTRQKGIVRDDAAPSAAIPHPVRQVSAESPVTPLVAVLREKQADLAELQREICKLQAEAGIQQQIVVRVQVLEVSLSKLEKLGLDVSSLESGHVSVSDTRDLIKASKILLVGGGFAQLPAKSESDSAQQLIKTLTKNNVAKILAEPTVVAMDGQPATVHTGSEIPYPAIAGPKGAVEMRPLGPELDVTPTSMGDNRVRLDLKLRISNADYSRMQEINGARVPLINVSQCNTGIESEFGQSTVLSGMIETRTDAIKRGGKTEEVSNRIALVFVVTPELVDATNAAQLPATPASPK